MAEIAEGRDRQVRIRISSGARATESALLEDLDERFDTTGGHAPRPLLVIVPSRSLRLHLLATIARRRGAVLGLSCITLHSLARSILTRCGRPIPIGGDLLLELLARRFARRERQLNEPLGGLRDGFAAVAATVRDLLDAGFDQAHAEALDEALQEATTADGKHVATAEATARAQALVRIARRTAEALDRHGSGGPSEILRQAAETLRTETLRTDGQSDDSQPALPPGEIFVHGFADATGLATDLLQAVLDRGGGTVYFDHPPDPASPGALAATDTTLLFGRRFRERLRAMAEPEEAGPTLQAAVVQRYRALGESAEVREAAERILTLLDGGATAETIAIVARDLVPYRTPLRIHLARLGIPFSAIAQPGPPHPSTRRIEVLLELLERRDAITLESWLDILTGTLNRSTLTDLRLAVAAGGWRRLRDFTAAGSSIDADRLRLPVFDRLGDRDGETRPLRRLLDTSALTSLRRIATATERRLREWPQEAAIAVHVETVESLMLQDLGWEPADSISCQVSTALATLRRLTAPQSLPEATAGDSSNLVVSREEFRLLLRRTLESGERLGDTCLAGTHLGGRGAGVQVLNAVEARGRTFEHLFVLGLNRGRFPRTVREDPILPDELRQVLGREGHGVLPDLESKRTGHFEERYLFAQLLSASPHVTLSWLEVADDDSRKSRSPLVERLRWSPGSDEALSPAAIPLARPIEALDQAGDTTRTDAAWRPRTGYEAVLVAGITDRQHLARLLPIALEEAWRETPPPSSSSDETKTTEAGSTIASSDTLAPHSVATARMAVLTEWDPLPGHGTRNLRVPGPYLGLIGRAVDDDDPRRANKLFVTTLESLARCPWQTFLSRVLNLEPLPDPLDGPPSLEASHTGSLVHRVLQSVADDAADHEIRGTLDQIAVVTNAMPSLLIWPDAETLDRRLRRFAEQLLRRQSIEYPGMATVLAAAARRHLEVARDLDSLEAEIPVARTAEIYGSVSLTGGVDSGRRLHFKADRAERLADGLRLTDFKTGRPLSTNKTAKSRHKKLLSSLATGQLLQAAAYARAAAETMARTEASNTDPVGSGRYLYLSPDLQPEILELPVTAEDAELFKLFDAVTSTLSSQWEAGVFFPRLEQAEGEKEPKACEYCRVKEACARGDSGVRRRLRQWVAEQAEVEREASAETVDELLTAGWRLSAKWVAPR